jgi:hypothetical protein
MYFILSVSVIFISKFDLKKFVKIQLQFYLFLQNLIKKEIVKFNSNFICFYKVDNDDKITYQATCLVFFVDETPLISCNLCSPWESSKVESNELKIHIQPI